LVWWRRPLIRQLLCDILIDELAHLRPGHRGLADLFHDCLAKGQGAALDALPLDDRAADGPRALALDSMELLSIAGAVSQRFGLDLLGIDDYLLARRRFGDWIDLIIHGREKLAGTADDSMVFFSSGSTGTPKPVRHRLDDLRVEIDGLIQGMGAPRRILALVPSHHIYGFIFTILGAARAFPAAPSSDHDGDALHRLDLRRQTPAALARQVQAGDWIIAHPGFWRLAAPRLGAMPQAVAISSTAPLDRDVAAQIMASGLRGYEIYGSTETAGLGLRRMDEPSFRLMAGWQRSAGEDDIRRADGRVADVQDHLIWDEDGRFRPNGRRDEAIQVLGINVYPVEIARFIETHPRVSKAAVRLMRPDEGDRLKAFVVPVDDPDPRSAENLGEDLMHWCAQKLAPAQCPRSFKMGPALPRTGMGKIMDWVI
jgi:4-coumarate--CoA ligase (photoactive yellow protein activation family)